MYQCAVRYSVTFLALRYKLVLTPAKCLLIRWRGYLKALCFGMKPEGEAKNRTRKRAHSCKEHCLASGTWRNQLQKGLGKTDAMAHEAYYT